jgi:hypothetical protein
MVADRVQYTITQGSVLEVHCPVYYVPGFEVKWTRADGQPVPSSMQPKDNVLRCVRIYGMHTLVCRIPNLSRSDDGEYKCHVTMDKYHDAEAFVTIKATGAHMFCS